MNAVLVILLSIFLTTMTPTAPAETPAPAVFVAKAATEEQLEAIVQVLASRLDALGLHYDRITTETVDDEARVLVTLEDELTEDALALLLQPGYLEFVDVDALDPLDREDAVLWTTGQAARLQATESEQEPPEDALIDPETERPFKTILDGTEITEAVASYEDDFRAWVITVTLSEEGSAIMDEYTGAHIDEALGIVVDGKLLTAPIIQTRISSPLWIQGNFTEAEARQLAAQLDSGPLPLPIVFIGYPSDVEP